MNSHTVKRRVNKMRRSDVPARLLFLCLSACLFAAQLVAGQMPVAISQVHGTVFVQDSLGQSYIAKARVTLKGPTDLEAETDESGKFEFPGVQPGTYTIEVTAPGLLGTQVVTVEVGKVTEIWLDLKPTAVQDSVTVTSTENDGPATSPSPSGTC
jgi:hypothetical protein